MAIKTPLPIPGVFSLGKLPSRESFFPIFFIADLFAHSLTKDHQQSSAFLFPVFVPDYHHEGQFRLIYFRDTLAFLDEGGIGTRKVSISIRFQILMKVARKGW